MSDYNQNIQGNMVLQVNAGCQSPSNLAGTAAAHTAHSAPSASAKTVTAAPHELKAQVIFIDNFDSFSYNLVDALKLSGCQVEVFRNDVDLEQLDTRITMLQAQGLPVVLVLSPGPSSPQDAGGLMQIIERFAARLPMLGICLGHQAIGLYLGGKVQRAPEIVHGKSSPIEHTNEACFKNLPDPLLVARYHSLVVTDLPESVKVLAHYENLCMALYEPKLKMLGLQFHPESIITTYGQQILEQALLALCEK